MELQNGIANMFSSCGVRRCVCTRPSDSSNTAFRVALFFIAQEIDEIETLYFEACERYVCRWSFFRDSCNSCTVASILFCLSVSALF